MLLPAPATTKMNGTTIAPGSRAEIKRRFRRVKIWNLNRSWRSWKASVTCTATVTAPKTLARRRLAEEFGFRIRTLQHGLEAYKIAPEIAKHGAGVSIFTDSWGYKIEA